MTKQILQGKLIAGALITAPCVNSQLNATLQEGLRGAREGREQIGDTERWENKKEKKNSKQEQK